MCLSARAERGRWVRTGHGEVGRHAAWLCTTICTPAGPPGQSTAHPPSPTPRAGRRLLPRQGARAPARPSSRPRALDTVPSTNKQSRAPWPDPVLAAPTAGICFSFLAAGEGVKCLHDDSGSRSHRHRGQQGCSHKPPWVATRTSPAFSINLRPRAGHESPSER